MYFATTVGTMKVVCRRQILQRSVHSASSLKTFLRNVNYVHLQHNSYSALIVSRHFARCAQMKQCTECTLLYYKNVCTSLLISDRCQHLNWRRLCIVLFPFARLAWLFLANLMRSLCVYNNNYLTHHICLIQESISCV